MNNLAVNLIVMNLRFSMVMELLVVSPKTAIDDGAVKERSTLCNEGQNEIAVSWALCMDYRHPMKS